MIKKIKSFILSAMLLMTAFAPALVPTAISYADACQGVPDQVAAGAKNASGGDIGCNSSGPSSDPQTALGDLANKIVNIFSIVVGAASIIMIVYGGFRYITSGGSSERVGAAKNTLIYAIVGLIIVGLSQILVHFVLSQTASTGSSFR